MKFLLQVDCDDCQKQFIVVDDDIEGDMLACPHCSADVPVPDDRDEDDDPDD